MACPTEAILLGDLNDPTSKVASVVNRQPVTVRRPEKETGPKVFYKGRLRRRPILWLGECMREIRHEC